MKIEYNWWIHTMTPYVIGLAFGMGIMVISFSENKEPGTRILSLILEIIGVFFIVLIGEIIQWRNKKK